MPFCGVARAVWGINTGRFASQNGLYWHLPDAQAVAARAGSASPHLSVCRLRGAHGAAYLFLSVALRSSKSVASASMRCPSSPNKARAQSLSASCASGCCRSVKACGGHAAAISALARAPIMAVAGMWVLNSSPCSIFRVPSWFLPNSSQLSWKNTVVIHEASSLDSSGPSPSMMKKLVDTNISRAHRYTRP